MIPIKGGWLLNPNDRNRFSRESCRGRGPRSPGFRASPICTTHNVGHFLLMFSTCFGGKVMCVVHWFCQTELAQHWSTYSHATSDADILHAVAAAFAGEEAGFLLALSCVGSFATWV